MAAGVAATRAAPPRASARHGLAVAAALAAVGALVRAVDPGRLAWLQNLLIVFASLLVEAMPFVLLGAAVSAGIEVLVSPARFARLGRLPRPLQLPAAALAGVAFPVCECGSVPVARRLVLKGLAPSAAVAFMLAAPIVNPVVVASTFVAYRGRDALWPIVGGRLVLGVAVAVAVGWVIGARTHPAELLRSRPTAGPAGDLGPADGSRLHRFFGHLAGDAMFMGRFLVVGAAIAAGVQTFVPQTVVNGLADLPVLSIVAMMAMAFVMSLCSESDAFVAASFVQFGPGAQLAFLVFGPMVDLKLVALYTGTFGRGFVRTVMVAVAAATLAGAMWVEVVAG